MTDTTANPIEIPPPPPGLEGILDRIRRDETDGVEDLRALAEQSPDSLHVLGALAWALAQRGEHEEAIALYRRCLEIAPADYELDWRIADRLVNLVRLDEALAAYQGVLERHPDCVDAKMGIRYVNYLPRQKDGKSRPYLPNRRQETELQRVNRELNEKEFEEQAVRLKSLPSRLYLESTTKCNFYCRTCSKGYAPYHAEDLHEDIFEKVRREVMPANVRISITGFGEPTMAGDFDSILQMAVDNGSHVHFVTNGSLLNYERIEKLTRCPVGITLSIDGATKETFESIRAGSNFDLILDKLGMIKKLRDIHLSGVYSHFSFNFVALRQNIHELPEVIRLAHRHGIELVNVVDYAFGDMEFDENSPRFDPDHANRCLEEARTVAEELRVNISLPPPYTPTPPAPPRSSLWEKVKESRRLFPEPHRFPRRCSSPWTEPYIHTDGVVTPCCASVQFLGNLQNDSFPRIWNGWRYRLLRRRIHSTFPPPSCRRCFVAWGINGGNAGNVMAKEGLLIKGLYALEIVARRMARRVLNVWKRLRSSPVQEGEPESSGNFYRGRPVSETNRSTSTKNSG